MKVPWLSSTFSAVILGIWKSSMSGSSDSVGSPTGPLRARPDGRAAVLLRIQLDDELLLHRRVDLLRSGQAQHLRREASRSRPGARPAPSPVSSVASRITSVAPLPALTAITSPARTWYEGMSTRRPLTVQWPWRTSCRAWRREAAKPSRTRTLSRRRSSRRSRFSPVTPGWRLAFVVVAAELLLEHAVVAARLLLLAQLERGTRTASGARGRGRPAGRRGARRRTCRSGSARP